MSKAKFYDTSLPLKERQESFLNATIEYYGKDPSKFRCLDDYLGCRYRPIENTETKGCAIGRYLNCDTQISLDAIGAIDDVYLDSKENLLPEWMRDLGENFLMDVQTLHDTNAYWNDSGLSSKGKDWANHIKKRIKNGYTK